MAGPEPQMNGTPRHAQLLGGRYVAVATVSRQKLRMGTPLARLLGTDSAFWRRRADGVPALPVHRVPATEGAPLVGGRLGADLFGALRRRPLPGTGRATMGNEGTGIG